MNFRLLSQIGLHLYVRLLRVVGRMYNPIVTRKIGAYKLKMPLAHELPVYLKLFPLYSANLNRLVSSVRTIKERLNIIDIGANVGDTVALLNTTANDTILCIEGDDYYNRILRLNMQGRSNVTVVKAFLGAQREKAQVQNDKTRGTGQLVEAKESLQIDTLDKVITQTK